MEVHLQVQSISLESNLELWTVYCSLLSGENERKCIYKFKVWLFIKVELGIGLLSIIKQPPLRPSALTRAQPSVRILGNLGLLFNFL